MQRTDRICAEREVCREAGLKRGLVSRGTGLMGDEPIGSVLAGPVLCGWFPCMVEAPDMVRG
jgi:hypothetical protein